MTIDESIIHIAQLLSETVHKHCVPIFAIQDEHGVTVCATGTLYQVADKFFLVSAGHVVQDAIDGQAKLATHNGIEGSHLIPLNERPYHTTYDSGRGRAERVFDLSIWSLNTEAVNQLLQGKVFANQSQVSRFADMRDAPVKELYYMCGYPTDLMRVDVSDDTNILVNPIRWITTGAVRSEMPESWDSRYHLGLDSILAKTIDGAGELTDVPQVPKGISGSGVWQICAEVACQGRWRPNTPKLVAVQTCVYQKSQLIRATGWAGVTSLISKAFPDLEPATELFYPT